MPVNPCERMLPRDEAAPAELAQGQPPGWEREGEAFRVAEASLLALAHSERDARTRLDTVPDDRSSRFFIHSACDRRGGRLPASGDLQLRVFDGDFIGCEGQAITAEGEMGLRFGSRRAFEKAAQGGIEAAPMQVGAIENCGIACVGDAVQVPLDEREWARWHCFRSVSVRRSTTLESRSTRL